MGDDKGDRMTDLYTFEDGTVANPDEVNHNFLLADRGIEKGIEVFEEDGTFTVPDEVPRIKVIVVGAGGGFDDGNDQHGGGGGGGTAIKILDVGEDLDAGDEITVTVGDGVKGSGGETSSFGEFCSATGGGSGSTGGGSTSGQSGGSGGIGVDGDLNLEGGGGGKSYTADDRDIDMHGGGTYLAGPARARAEGTQYGGGHGAYCGLGEQRAGADGVVVVMY